jgi:hypothetical protein
VIFSRNDAYRATKMGLRRIDPRVRAGRVALTVNRSGALDASYQRGDVKSPAIHASIAASVYQRALAQLGRKIDEGRGDGQCGCEGGR